MTTALEKSPQNEPQRNTAIHRHLSRSSLGSNNSTTTTSTNGSPPDRRQLDSLLQPAEPDHDPASCLSCTRRNVISVFPRFRKVSTRLLTTLYRGSMQKTAGPCPADGARQKLCDASSNSSSTTASASGTVSASDPPSRDPPLSRVFPASATRAALCLGRLDPESARRAGDRPDDQAAVIPLPTIPDQMAKGSALLKTTSRSAHIRNFRLDIAQQRITWDSRKKKKLAHIDLENIVELRVGEEALWAVGDEGCLPHGTQRLFAIVYYHQMVLKTVCIVAPTNETFYEWLDTLTYLLSSRQPVTTLAQHQRWRLISINRQWWESDTSGESATDAMRFIEACVNGSQSSTSSLDVASELASTVTFSSSPVKNTAGRKWFSGNNGASAVPSSIANGARSASRASSFSSLIMPAPVFRTNEGNLQQRVCNEDTMVDVADTIKKSHAQPSVDSMYHDITLSYMNHPQMTFSEAKADMGSKKGLGIELDFDFGRIHNEDALADDGCSEDSDHLVMASSKTQNDEDRNDSGYLLHLDIPKSQPFGITLSVFSHFLRDAQKEDISDNEIRRRFREFTSHSGQQVMATYEFEAYLLSAYNSIGYQPKGSTSDASKECFDMDMPLNEYYISSSHNTYLAGDQLVGDSTVEGYVHALLRGCRCLELDCWDGRCGEPVVCHGHTFTTRILFEDVIIAISRYAFAVSPYPVILSFETHCSLPQQARMATILKKHLGDMIVLAPVNGSSETVLPSPNQLKHRIIIKNKVLETPVSRPPSLASSQPAAAIIAGIGQSNKTVSPRSSAAQLKRKVAPELSQMIVYCRATHFEGLEEDSPEPVFNQVTSVSETTSNQQIRQKPAEYNYYNSAQMTRVYPAFSRFTSTNFNPIPHWAAGCQLVALNFQTRDKNMQIYEAMFQRTRGLGYVLKPKNLRNVQRATSTEKSKTPPQVASALYRPTGNERGLGSVPSAPSSPPSWISLLKSATDELPENSGDNEFPQRITVHINVISAHGAVRCSGGSGNGNSGEGSQRRQSLTGIIDRRPSFASDSSDRRNSNSFALVDQASSPGPLSRPPSGVAMFASDMTGFFAAASAVLSGSAVPSTPPVVGQQSLNAAATAAAAAAATAMASAKSVAGQQSQGFSSRIRVEIEWLSETNFEGSSSSGSSSDSSSGAGQGPGFWGPFAAAHSRSGSQSRCATVPSSPVIRPQNIGAVAFPFLNTNSNFNSVMATPLVAPPPAPTPFVQSSASDLHIRKNRYMTKNGIISGNEVRWRNSSLFRVVNDPNISFVRMTLFDDDLEMASTCISIDSLKEGYRFIELGESDKSKLCRPIYLLVNIQVSQLHCLASMPAMHPV